ncbi:PaaX family transcriptional regulator C-terminal domain-containing protein [Rhodococcus sp. TAF43]|uniref:PaaX family transcriptional regulator n=1 Tax=unclassified Rhodococcus (in: high G+C Gram-positive bacteria) TaxID=192944 RepID=UPI0015837BE9|nr:PaaX family transcriptional regulator C-terminal domain-containing protein [Rhodococcus sp. W8901]QKT10280.1 PaaX family transcriptional regulator [Rhodococcus sp. W8901]
MRYNLTAEPVDKVDITPKSLLLAFLGMHLLWKPIAISGASLVELFGWLDVGQSATRSLLARMTDRGLLERHKVGRKTYYALTEHGTSVFEEGSKKIWRSMGGADWDGVWTTVALSVPEDSRHLRHRARSRLSWAGFGNTASGLWVAPRRHNVATILGPEFADVDLTVMVGRVLPPTTDEALVTSAFDLDEIAARYTGFTSRWQNDETSGSSREHAFATRIRVQAEWLSITQTDPLLPMSLLPENWPAGDAERLFRVLDATLDRASIGIEADGLDSIAL